MHDFLSVYKVARRFYLVQKSSNIVVPLIKNIIRELVFLEDDDAIQTVDLGSNACIDNHIADLNLNTGAADTNEVRQAIKLDACIVLLNNADVVLDQLLRKLSYVERMMLCSISVRLIGE